MRSRSQAVAVLLSDAHFTVSTLELASQALRAGLHKAEELNVPLVIAGDTLDSKAVIRGEVANRLIEIFKEMKYSQRCLMLVGNHDLLSEKSDEHSLNFLRPYVEIVQKPVYDRQLESWLVPYHSNPVELFMFLRDQCSPGQRIICHQGVQGAAMGHYVVDKTSLPRESFADFRVISGHYHKAQDIKCGRPRRGAVGLFTYIGNPYTLSFAEAGDPSKGYAVLMDDGLLERIPLNLRQHVIIEADVNSLRHELYLGSPTGKDVIWLKVTGPASELAKINKSELGKSLFGHSNFKLDLIPTEAEASETDTANLTNEQMVDSMIDELSETTNHKAYLKNLWREIVE